MSFHVEFYAQSAADASAILDEERTLPEHIRTFIRQGLTGCADSGVYVKASGHLYSGSGSYDVSNVDVRVHKINLRVPKPVVD